MVPPEVHELVPPAPVPLTLVQQIRARRQALSALSERVDDEMGVTTSTCGEEW